MTCYLLQAAITGATTSATTGATAQPVAMAIPRRHLAMLFVLSGAFQAQAQAQALELQSCAQARLERDGFLLNHAPGDVVTRHWDVKTQALGLDSLTLNTQAGHPVTFTSSLAREAVMPPLRKHRGASAPGRLSSSHIVPSRQRQQHANRRVCLPELTSWAITDTARRPLAFGAASAQSAAANL